MTEAQVLALIVQWVKANGNNEITGPILQNVLTEMLQQPNDKMGELADLDTVDKSSIIAAINELADEISNVGGFTIHTGAADPNITPPASFGIGDWYVRNGSSIYQYNGSTWVLITDSGASTSADSVSYDNATSGLAAINVQQAIDELEEEIDNIVITGTTPGIPIPYLFNDSLAGDPGSEHLAINNADPALATILFLSETSDGAGSVADLISTLSVESQIIYRDPTDVSTYQVYKVTGAPTDQGTYWTVPVERKAGGSGIIADETVISVLIGLADEGFNYLLEQDLDAGGNKITNLADGVDDGDAINKGQFDAFAASDDANLDTFQEAVDAIKAIQNTLISDNPALDSIQEIVDAIEDIQSTLSTDNPAYDDLQKITDELESIVSDLSSFDLQDAWVNGQTITGIDGTIIQFNPFGVAGQTLVIGQGHSILRSGQGIAFTVDGPSTTRTPGEIATSLNANELASKGWVIEKGNDGNQNFTSYWESGGDADPEEGYFRTNNAGALSTTFFYVNDISQESASSDISGHLQNLASGDKIRVGASGMPSPGYTGDRYGVFTVTGTPVDGGGYWKIPVTCDWWFGTNTWAGLIFNFGIVPSTSSGGITDAPNDGQTYARKNQAWEDITSGLGSGGIPEAPNDGGKYVRENEAWSDISGDLGGGGASQSEYGLLPRRYDARALNIFVDPSFVGVEAGTIAQPYSTMSEAETALENSNGTQHVHVYLKSGEYFDPIEITDGRGKDFMDRNRIATYGGVVPAIIGQFDKARPTFTQVGATNVWTTPASTIAGFYALTTRFKRSTDGVVHTIQPGDYTSNTITCATLSGYTGLVGCQVDYQESPFNFRTARITAFNGTDTITLDTTEGGNISFLGGTITHSFKIYGMRSELDADQQWASENVSGDNLIAVYSTGNPNSLSPFFIPMYNESSIKVGTSTAQFNAYWEIDNINFQWNGRDAIEVQGDYTNWRITNCQAQNSLRCGMSFFGSFNNTANRDLEVNNNSIYDYGASGLIQWRARRPKIKNMVIGYGDGHDDGEFYGARFAVASSNTVNVFGAAISCVYYRDVVGGDPLDDARADGEYSNILIFGTYENGILMSGYGNRVSATYIRGHSIFCTDTGGIYNGSDFSHRLAYDGVFVNGETTLSSMRDQYIGGTGEIGSVGAVHGFYTDNFSYNTSHRNCVAINNTDGFGFFRNVRGHYNSYKDCLAANNLVGYFRGDVFGGATNPAKFTEFERNTILSIGRAQKAWYWFATGVTITDEIRGTHNGNLYLHVGDGGNFTPQVTGINATRAQTGTSLETAKEVIGGIDENSRSITLWDLYAVNDYTEVAEIVNGAITDFSSNVLNEYGTVTYNATDDCYEVTPGAALNIGDIDVANVLDIPNSFFDYTPNLGDVITFVMEFEADQDGMYFDFGIYNGSSVEKRYIVNLKRGRHTYILQHICEANFGGTWYIPTRPIKSSEEDGLTYKFHSCTVYRGTGSEYGSIEAVQNYIKDDTATTNENAVMFMEELAVSTERPTDTPMMIPELTGGIQLLTSDPDGDDVRLGLSCRFTRNDAFVKASLITSALMGLEGAREVKKIIEMKDQAAYDALPTATKETPGYVFLVPE